MAKKASRPLVWLAVVVFAALLAARWFRGLRGVDRFAVAVFVAYAIGGGVWLAL